LHASCDLFGEFDISGPKIASMSDLPANMLPLSGQAPPAWTTGICHN